MSSHTPGPWTVHPTRLDEVYDSDGIMVAGTFAGGDREDEPRANARLIAVAPELLEAAKEVINVLYATDTDLSGEQERTVEQLLWAQMKAERKA